MNLLEKIKMLCSDRNMSVGDLEKELELGNGSIYKWNKSIPRVDTLLKVANYFGVDINYLLEEKE
ncbi:MAG: helix-turn-helix transcriptional regulator [Peptostreptococcales bacterium]